MDGAELDADRGLAQTARVADIGLDAALPDTEGTDERGRYNSHVVACFLGISGNGKGLGAGLHDDPTGRECLEEALEFDGGKSLLEPHLVVVLPNADLGFPSAEIDGYMVHGCPPSRAP